MAEADIFCRVCLEEKRNNFSLYLYVQEKYLPSVIEKVCGVLISSLDEPEAHICKECALAIIEADEIILKCQESHKILEEQQHVFKTVDEQLKNETEADFDSQHQRIREIIKHVQTVRRYEADNVANDFDMQLLQRATLDSNLTNNLIQVKQETQELPDLDSIDECLYVEPKMLVESILENPETTNDNTAEAILTSPLPAPLPSMYCCTTKGTRPKNKYVRNREQYLKRKMRNLPVKEPLTLIGGAGVVRKRKPKSFHRAIPNFYFQCELCHEFESNVASYSVTHLNIVHQIDRPAIFKCQLCDAKPFIKNQSLQEHIKTIHQQQPKPRNYICKECGKSFIKNCHLKKHLMSVHKSSLLAHQYVQAEYGKSHINHFALKVNMKQIQSEDQPCVCKLCDKRFPDICGLHTHIKTMHPINSSYTCAPCGHKFTTKARYEAHVRHSHCKSPSLTCHYCERTYDRLAHLKFSHQDDPKYY